MNHMSLLKAHNTFDFCLGAIFIASPFIFGFSGVHFARDVFMVLGIFVVGYSLLTDYPYSLAKAIPIGMHLIFDGVCGIFVILAPWIYGYQDLITRFQHSIHWLLGIAVWMGIAAASWTVPQVPESAAARTRAATPPPPPPRAGAQPPERPRHAA